MGAANWMLGTGDDEIGSNAVVLDMRALEDCSRTKESDFREGNRPRTGLKYNFFSRVSDGDYYSFFTVGRMPEVPNYPNPVFEIR